MRSPLQIACDVLDEVSRKLSQQQLDHATAKYDRIFGDMYRQVRMAIDLIEEARADLIERGDEDA